MSVYVDVQGVDKDMEYGYWLSWLLFMNRVIMPDNYHHYQNFFN